MLKATFERTSPELALIGQTAAWELELLNTSSTTKVITSTLEVPYVLEQRSETLTEAAATYDSGATGAANVHTLPPNGRAVIGVSYTIPNIDGVRITPSYTLTWPKEEPTLRLANGQTLTRDPNVVEVEADPVLANYNDPTEHLEAINSPGRLVDWVYSDDSPVSRSTLVDAMASGLSFDDYIRSRATGTGGVSLPTPGNTQRVVLKNPNGSTTHVAQRRLIDQLVPATGYQWFDMDGTAIAAPVNDTGYTPGRLRVARADFDLANSATTFQATWANTEPSYGVAIFETDGREAFYNLTKTSGGNWAWERDDREVFVLTKFYNPAGTWVDAWDRMMAALPRDAQGDAIGKCEIPMKLGGYDWDRTATIPKCRGLTIYAPTGTFPQVRGVDLTTGVFTGALINWTGGAEAMFEIDDTNVAAFNLTLDGVTIDGKNTATIGVDVGLYTDTKPVKVSTMAITDCWVVNCRIGIACGDLTNELDIANITLERSNLQYNLDHGFVCNSGNFEGSITNTRIQNNGYSPTTDTLNPSGIGCNVYAESGQLALKSVVTAGRDRGAAGDFRPTSCDFRVRCEHLTFDTLWSETDSCWINQRGHMDQFVITGSFHYNDSFTDVSVPVSIDHQAPLTMTSSVVFGDINGVQGNEGNITWSGKLFWDDDLPTKRPTMGRGRFTGTMHDTGSGALGLNTNGDEAQISMGGGGTADVLAPYKGYAPYKPRIRITSQPGYMFEFLGADDGDPACRIWRGLDGSMRTETNCYQINPDSYLPDVVGKATITLTGNDNANAPLGFRVYEHDFLDLVTPVALGSFTGQGGI